MLFFITEQSGMYQFENKPIQKMILKEVSYFCGNPDTFLRIL